MNSIIAQRSKAREEARRLIEREVSSRYEEERKRAGLWRRLMVWMIIQKEVAEEMKRKFPPQALYAQHFVR